MHMASMPGQGKGREGRRVSTAASGSGGWNREGLTPQCCGAPRRPLWGTYQQPGRRHADKSGTRSRSPCRGRRSVSAARPRPMPLGATTTVIASMQVKLHRIQRISQVNQSSTNSTACRQGSVTRRAHRHSECAQTHSATRCERSGIINETRICNETRSHLPSSQSLHKHGIERLCRHDAIYFHPLHLKLPSHRSTAIASHIPL